MIKFLKKFKNCFVFLMVVLAFCLMSFVSFPIAIASDDSMQDYFKFDQALSQMLNEYDTMSNDMVALASFDEEESQVESTNRLIVETSSILDDCGAVAKAEFKNYHIFQYSNFEESQKAYDYFSNIDGAQVGYDFVVSIADLYQTEETEIDSTYNYMSWGAEYVGYQTYTESMLASVSQDNLEEVVVAVIDSGINTSHKIFKDRILYNYGKNYTTENSTTSYAFEDFNGHGTHVSGIIAESTLSNVKILPLKVLASNGRGYVASIVSAITYAIELKNSIMPNLKVMNMSIGVDDSSSVDSLEASGQGVGAKSTSLNNAVIEAYNNEILSVVSAGNENRNTSFAVPANVDCALTISAVMEDYDFATGKNLVFHGEWHNSAGYSNYGNHVDFCAPGSYIKSAYKGSSTATATLSGTSMAAPHATAVVALVYSNPIYSEYEIEELTTLLKQNADKSDLYTSGVYAVSSSERDNYYGYGLISVKNIGLVTSGYVSFSQTDEFPTQPIEVSLAYDGEVDKSAGQYSKIYYSTNENVVALDINSSVAKLYSSPISVSATTKITAVACVYDDDNVLIRKSHSSSRVYYYNNFDLSINFEYDTTTSGIIIKKYLGKLTNLELPEKINGTTVVGIGEGAFNDSGVEKLQLPAVSNFNINSRAFYAYNKLKEISAKSSTLKIGSESFRYCDNLETASIENAVSIGDYAFANNSKLSTLYLPKIEQVGQHAFSGTKLKNLLVGQDIEVLKTQSALSLQKIWGYSGTIAETFALENDIDFCDLTLKIVDDFSKRKILRQSDEITLELEFVAFKPTYSVSLVGAEYSASLLSESDFYHTLKITLSDMDINQYDLRVDLFDNFNNKISSSQVDVIVLRDDAKTHTINFDAGQFEVYVDDELILPSTILFDNFDYEIKVLSKNGYEIEYVMLGQTEVQSSFYVSALSEDLNLSVATKEKESLIADFVKQNGGKILIDDQEVNSFSVERGQNLTFEVVPESGYKIKCVKLDGQILTGENNIYTIENVVTDMIIEVDFELLKYSVTLTCGKGGSVFHRGVLTNSADIAHGSDLSFDVVCSDGYVVDFVKVNGVEIALVESSFVIENISEDCDIVVAFKTASASLFDSEHSTILKYFIVFVSLFAVFIVAKIVLTIVRKKKKSK